MTAVARRHPKRKLRSWQSQPPQYHIAEWIVLRHWVTVINAITLKLRFQRLTPGCDGPNVLRPAVALPAAYQPATETLTKQVQRRVPGEYADLIAKRFAHSRSRGGCEAEVAGVTLVLWVAAAACRCRPSFELCGRKRSSVVKCSFRIEGLACHALYEHNWESPAVADRRRVSRVTSGPERSAARDGGAA